MIIEKFSNFYTPKEKIVVEAATETVVENVATFNDSMQKTATIIGLFESLSADLNLVHKDELESVSKLIIDHVSTNIDNLKIQLKDLSKNDLNLVNENIKILAGKVAGLNEHANTNFEKYSKLVYDTSLNLEKKIKAVETQDLVKEDLSRLAEDVARIEEGTKQELKKQTKLVYDTASGLDEKIKSIKVIDFLPSINELQNQIDSIQESVNDANQLQKTTSEKYNRLVYDSALTLEQKINDVSSLIDQKVNSIEIPDYTYLEEQIKTVQGTIIDIAAIKPVPDMTDKVVSIEKRLNVVEDKKLNEQKKATNLLKEEILSLESHISSFNDKIQEQNSKYVELEQNTKQAITEAKRLLVDDKYVEINRKINFIEQVLEKFNEKTVLTEGVLDAPPETKTPDPLTPLNQNFVTFEQLQKHYSLFINRIQQQLTTIGGGGAVLLYDLDDVNYNSVKNANDGDVLTYNSANLKWEAAVSAGGGGGGSYGDSNVYSNVSLLLSTYATTANVTLKSNIADLTTSNVTELTNLYFTNVRAVAAVTNGTLSNLTVQGNITVTTGTINAIDVFASGNITSPYFYSQSDINLKKDLVHVANALNIVNLLDGYWFKWKNNDVDSIGLIAQHVESVLPMLIGNSPDGSKTVLYNGIIAILLEAIKEQQVQIDEIKAKLNEKH